jgi:hypothetical protein
MSSRSRKNIAFESTKASCSSDKDIESSQVPFDNAPHSWSRSKRKRFRYQSAYDEQCLFALNISAFFLSLNQSLLVWVD